MPRVAILGATGAVGQEMLQVMAERNFPADDLVLLAGKTTAGKKVEWQGREFYIQEAKPELFDGVDITLVAVSNDLSLMFTPEAVKRGSVVIDNSSAYRLDPDVPLVIPEVNPEDIRWHKGIIANPNCSTIIALVAVKPLHDYAGVERMVVSTYQSVSGAGAMGVTELEQQMQDHFAGRPLHKQIFQHQIAFNLIPHIDAFQPNGYTKEEMKMQNESRKMLHAPNLQVSCTCVRVPVIRSHSEAITIETSRKLPADKARELLSQAPGVRLVDSPMENGYPTPLDTSNQDLIYVGRIREDISKENSLVLWACGDQVRKGAATNAVQIAEMLVGR
jgi:aspartate-semialdehyde dehydrogenase